MCSFVKGNKGKVESKMNTFGRILRLTTFGESHGVALGGVLDGVPAGLKIDFDAVQQELARRRPGQSAVTTARQERDEVEFLSGIMNGTTLGTPIGFIIRNQDQRSADYDALAHVYRPSHADYTYEAKYGIRDPRGGGRASARETVCRVVAGAIAQQLLAGVGIEVVAYATAIGPISLGDEYLDDVQRIVVDESAVRCPIPEQSEQMMEAVLQAKAEGDSLGGSVACIVRGVPAGWGEPIYDKLSARLASAMLSINAARAFEMGDAHAIARQRGSAANDEMTLQDGRLRHRTNHSGGIIGGISNGETLRMRIAFKPTATIGREQHTLSDDLCEVVLATKGRHDPTVVPRAVPIVEAMAALVLADFYLLSRATSPLIEED